MLNQDVGDGLLVHVLFREEGVTPPLVKNCTIRREPPRKRRGAQPFQFLIELGVPHPSRQPLARGWAQILDGYHRAFPPCRCATRVGHPRDRVNLVFMGQGEPFLNYDNFMQAVRLLVEGVGIPESRMTVSTSGIVPRIADFGAEPVRPKLAVSLNAPNEALRTEVMPITKKWTIEKLMAALREFPLRNRERLTFEYVLLGGVNDGVQHAREMVDLIRGLRAKVNLIE